MVTPNASRKHAPVSLELCGHWTGLLLYRLGAAVADASYAWGDIDSETPSSNAPAIGAQPSIPNSTYEQLYS